MSSNQQQRRKKLEEIRVIFRRRKYPAAAVEFEGGFLIGEASFSRSGDRPEWCPHTFTVKGEVAAADSLTASMEYRLYGKWDRTSQKAQEWGPQFAFQTLVLARPHSETAIVKYLTRAGKGHGLGAITARSIYRQFRGDSVRILRESPDVVASAVTRFSVESAEKVAKQLEFMESLEETFIDTIELLDGRGFPKALTEDVIRVWGNEAPAIINADPHKLMRFRGVGWKKADAMYLDLGLPPERLKRQAYCATYEAASDTDGHVWIPVDRAIRGINANVAGAQATPEKALSLATRGKIAEILHWCERCEGKGTVERFWGEDPCPKCNGNPERWFGEIRRVRAEEYIAEKSVEMMGWQASWPEVTPEAFPRLSPHQRENLKKALNGSLCILGGSPGVGKTWTAAALIKVLVAKWGDANVVASAPTGKAATRLNENLQRYGLRIPCGTIHRTLGVRAAGEDSEDGGWSFNYGSGNPLPVKVWVIDEVSMIPNDLMASALTAVARGTMVLLVGDVNQLPPVGPGAPLRDFITAGVPYGELREIRRNSGQIVQACADIRDRKPFETSKKINLETGDNLFLQLASKANAPQTIVDTVKRIRDTGKYDPIWDVQVCVAVNDRSPCSRKKLNGMLQQVLNPGGRSIRESPFRVNDKVICLKNSTFPIHPKRYDGDGNEAKTMVSNGEFGKVLEIAPTKTIVQFTNPDRRVLVPRGQSQKQDSDNNGSDGAAETTTTGCDLELGYAATVHKMQGSSAPIVIVTLDEYPGASGKYGICDRAWLYTAISRAEDLCVLVGLPQTARSICGRQFIGRRKTFLAEKMQKNLRDRGMLRDELPKAIESSELDLFV